MPLHLSPDVTILFILTTIVAGIFFYAATAYSRKCLAALTTWMLVQGILGITGFYLHTGGFPARFILMPVPPLILIAVLFSTRKGRKFIDGVNIHWLTWIHTVRVPVEIGLLLLAQQKLVPSIMTFEGTNFDLISGLSAPFIAIWGFRKNLLTRRILIVWNVICLALLCNVVVTAVLSTPSTFQRLSFDQPNIGILYFPVVWLPSCIVPLVAFAHLAAIRQLFDKGKFYGKLYVTVVNTENDALRTDKRNDEQGNLH